jgi:cyclopropane fatty-acyl-phospholipid synthase-like methyltransferase
MLSRFQQEIERRRIERVQLCQADVMSMEALPPSWREYDLILSASMLEYLPKQDLPSALAGLRARLAVGGHMLVMITRKTPETRVLIEWVWKAERYTKCELIESFHRAGFRDLQWFRFPRKYFWLNRANYVVVAAT